MFTAKTSPSASFIMIPNGILALKKLSRFAKMWWKKLSERGVASWWGNFMTKIERIYQCLIASLIFLIPSNLFLKFLVDSAYVNGLLVDYLLPKLYVSDLPILLMLGIWLFELVKKRAKFSAKFLPLILLLAMFGALQFLTAKPFAAIWFLGKLIE